MLDSERELWIDLMEAYKELSFLWDTKDKNYLNRKMRTEAYEILLEKYLKIDPSATVEILKKRMENMRTAYNRERKKVMLSLEHGLESPHVPSLWYYNHLSFLDEVPLQTKPRYGSQTGENYSFSFNRYKNKIYLEKNKKKGLKRLREEVNSSNTSPKEERRLGYINIDPQQSSEEEPTEPRPQPKRRILDLLQKQERFIDTATRILIKKEKDWEIIGKAIGLQLRELEATQQTIAQKLISDTIFYGNLGKLSMDTSINVQQFEPGSPQFNEEVICKVDHENVEIYLKPETPTYEEFRDKLDETIS